MKLEQKVQLECAIKRELLNGENLVAIDYSLQNIVTLVISGMFTTSKEAPDPAVFHLQAQNLSGDTRKMEKVLDSSLNRIRGIMAEM